MKTTPTPTTKQTNTVLQFSVLTLALSRALWDVPSAEIFEPLCLLTGATTVGSGLTYLVGDGACSSVLVCRGLHIGGLTQVLFSNL